MIETFNERCSRLHTAIDEYIQTRLKAKLEKLEKEFDKDKSDDAAVKLTEQKNELTAKHSLRTWIGEKAGQAKQLRFATHILKAIHPDAKGTVLYCSPRDLPPIEHVSSHHLSVATPDVIGNAAALDIVPLLALNFDGESILDLMERQDEDLLSVLSDEPEAARQIMKEFAKLKIADDDVSSHSLAKQLYWLSGEDATDDSQFELLAPLFASALTHYVYETIQTDKFGDKTKPQREAKKSKEYHSEPVYDYPNLLIQKIGGSNPQNISTLNSKRSGVNYLLPSLPPIWVQKTQYPPFNTASIFELWFNRQQLKFLVEALHKFLKSNPPKNEATRATRDQYLSQIIDQIQDYANDLLILEPGWSANSECTLVSEQKIWLDPDAVEFDEDLLTIEEKEWQRRVAEQFGRSINHLLGEDLDLGDAELKHWSEQFVRMLA
jgi:CRISPR-associated protein Csy1